MSWSVFSKRRASFLGQSREGARALQEVPHSFSALLGDPSHASWSPWYHSYFFHPPALGENSKLGESLQRASRFPRRAPQLSHSPSAFATFSPPSLRCFPRPGVMAPWPSCLHGTPAHPVRGHVPCFKATSRASIPCPTSYSRSPHHSELTLGALRSTSNLVRTFCLMAAVLPVLLWPQPQGLAWRDTGFWGL